MRFIQFSKQITIYSTYAYKINRLVEILRVFFQVETKLLHIG